MNHNVCAIIVLYNPDDVKLQKLFDSLKGQTSNIVFIDNSPSCQVQEKNKAWVVGLLADSYYISMNGNAGIATAQNAGIAYAKNIGAEYVLLLDQDSSLPQGMVQGLLETYHKLENQGKRVATVGPAFIDAKTQKYAKIFKRSKFMPKKIRPNTQDIIEVDYAIASGSFICINVFDCVGNLKDELFIDWVDIEWCYRAREYGFASYVIPQIVMIHSLGDKIVQNLDVSLHSDFRNYFIVRNALYLALYSKLPVNFRLIQLFKTPLYILFYSYHSKRPFYSFMLLLIAVKDAIFKNMGKGYFAKKEI